MRTRFCTVCVLPLLLVCAASCPAQGERPEGVPEIVIDHERMCPVVEGEPFFAIGCCWIPAQHMKECADAGFNLAIRWGDVSGTGLKRALSEGEEMTRRYVRDYLDAAEEAGLRVIEWPLLFSYEPLALWEPVFLERFDRFIQDPLPLVLDLVKDHPALFGYYGPDEPGERHRKACLEYSRVIRRRDPWHPLLFCGLTPVLEWAESCDITWDGHYPRPDETPLIATYYQVLHETDVAHRNDLPYWHIPLMEFSSNSRMRPLSPAAQRAQVYLALIGGADGIVWWRWTPCHIDTWNMIKQLAGEMQALTGVLTEAPAPTKVRWEPSELRQSVQVRAIKHEGRTWLLAANACETPARVRFVLPTNLSDVVRVWFEDRELGTSGPQFTDRFEGHGRHVYEIHDQWPEEAEIVLEVELEEEAVQVAEVHQHDPLRPNLLYDPGFESDLYWAFSRGKDRGEEARGWFHASSHHTGARSAVIERTGAKAKSVWTGRWVQLKANTGYTFGGWARSQASWKASVEMYLQLERAAPWAIVRRLNLYPNDLGPWRQYSTVLVSPDEPAHARPVCRFMHSSWEDRPGADGKAWFDDLFLVEAPPGVRNMLVNGGFEGPEVAPGWPRWWWCPYSLRIPGHIGGTDALWGLDESEAYEGRRSLRLVNPGTGDGAANAEQELAVTQPLVKGRDYVFSAYMKADRPQVLVTMRAGGYGALCKQRRVSDQWQRYVVSVRLERDVETPFVGVYLDEEGKLWVDGVQFEQGTEATQYREWRE